MQERRIDLSSDESEQFLIAAIGKLVKVYTTYPHEIDRGGASLSTMGGAFHGQLEAIFPDAVVVEQVTKGQATGSRVMIYKRAIIAIETRTPPPTP